MRFEPLSDAELLRWASARLKPLGKRVSQQAISHLAFTAGRDLTRLSGEVDKLADYIGERAEIAVEDIEAVVSPSLEFSVFEMLDFLFAGDLARAERSLQTLLMGGQTCVGVFSMVVRQLRMLAHLALAQRAGDARRQWKKRSNCTPMPPRRAAATGPCAGRGGAPGALPPKRDGGRGDQVRQAAGSGGPAAFYAENRRNARKTRNLARAMSV